MSEEILGQPLPEGSPEAAAHANFDAAKAALGDPNLSPAILAQIAYQQPALWVAVAGHPAAYADLLRWLAEYGDDTVKQAVQERWARSGGQGENVGGAGAGVVETVVPDSSVTPLPVPVGSGAAETATPEAATPSLSPAAPTPARGGRPWRLKIGVATLAGVMVVSAGVVFGVPSIRDRLFSVPPEPSADNTPAVTTPLTVVNPLNLNPSFAYGYTETWRITGAETGASRPTGAVAFDDMVVIGQHNAPGTELIDPQGARLIGVESATGLVEWSAEAVGAPTYCLRQSWRGLAVCRGSDEGASSPLPYLVDPTTGQAADIGLDAVIATEGQPEMRYSKEASTYQYAVGHDVFVAYLMKGNLGYDITPQMALWDEPGHLRWHVPAVNQGQGDGRGSYLGLVDDLVYWEVPNAVTLFDAATGDEVSQGDCRATVFGGNHIACSAYSGDLPAPTYPSATLSSGATVTFTATPGYPLFFLDDDRPETILTTVDDGTALVAIDPANGRETWRVSGDFGRYTKAAWDGRDKVAITGDSGTVSVVDISQGTLLWQDLVASPGAQFFLPRDPEAQFIDDQTIWVKLSFDDGRAYIAATGEVVWSGPFVVQRGGPVVDRPAEPIYVLHDPDGTSWTFDYIARFDPVLPGSSGRPSAATPALPAGFPKCPSGLDPVSWIDYPGGLVLICGAVGKDFQVLARDAQGQEREAHTLTFTDGGYFIDFADGTTLRACLGGAVVVIESGNERSVKWAAETWHLLTGPATFEAAAPPNLPDCPADTWPISLSTWNGGWLLVCGTAANDPQWLAYDDADVGSGDSDAVTGTAQDTYCAEWQGGSVCAHRAPALVTFTPSGGDPDQRAVSTNAFAGAPAGGTGQGTGAYGVDAPTDTADDQVRYLVDILNASGEGRSSVGQLTDDLNDHISGPSHIAGMQAVVDNRVRLQVALESTPVTLIPNGSALVSTLKEALRVSEECDRLYVTWAEIIRDGRDDKAIVAQWRPVAHQSEVLKEQFVAVWNSEIAPRYGVQTFRADQI
jgi:outer membrane protein assembly factor BamB